MPAALQYLPCLWSVLSAVADFAVESAVSAVVVGQAVQEAVALQATEAVLVIPKALQETNISSITLHGL